MELRVFLGVASTWLKPLLAEVRLEACWEGVTRAGELCSAGSLRFCMSFRGVEDLLPGCFVACVAIVEDGRPLMGLGDVPALVSSITIVGRTNLFRVGDLGVLFPESGIPLEGYMLPLLLGDLLVLLALEFEMPGSIFVVLVDVLGKDVVASDLFITSCFEVLPLVGTQVSASSLFCIMFLRRFARFLRRFCMTSLSSGLASSKVSTEHSNLVSILGEWSAITSQEGSAE